MLHFVSFKSSFNLFVVRPPGVYSSLLLSADGSDTNRTLFSHMTVTHMTVMCHLMSGNR